MAESLYRTQLLLEPDQHRALTQIARQEGRSVSDLVRELIREQLTLRRRNSDATLEHDRMVFARIRQHSADRTRNRRTQGETSTDNASDDVAGMIEQMRDERDEQLTGISLTRR